MTQPMDELNAWLTGSDLVVAESPGIDEWVAGFDPDRQAVLLRLGPFKRLFLRPAKFTKRFYHQLFPLPVETWLHRKQIKLFEEFCCLEVELNLSFQATLQYVHKHIELIGVINQHIKQLYADIVADIVDRELQSLADGIWVRQGLAKHEQRLALAVCEFFTQQHIQVQAACVMAATFAEFPDVQLGKDSVYVNVLQKTFELNQEKANELMRQQRIAEQLELEEKQRQLAHLQQLAEIQRQIQAQEAELQRQLLLDKERQLANQRSVEHRLHAEQIQHEQRLEEISFDIKLQSQQHLQAKQRSIEAQQLSEQLQHQALIEDQKVLAEIQRRQSAQQRWKEAALLGEQNPNHSDEAE